jgi:hypothetical protein
VELYDRMSQVQDEVRQNGSYVRFLPAASLVVAAFSFMLTTVVWRLVHQTSAVEAAVQESIVGINRFSAASSREWARLHDAVAAQAAAAERLDARLSGVESAGIAGLERIRELHAEMTRQSAVTEQVRQELARAASGVSQSRQDILERLAVHADRSATDRDAMIRDVNAAIAEVEQSLLTQAENFQQHKQQFDAVAERDRATRRAMLQEATRAVSLQVEGLRQILDGLQVEAGAVAVTGDSEPAGPATEPAEAVTAGSPEETGEDLQPATAALEKEAVLE